MLLICKQTRADSTLGCRGRRRSCCFSCSVRALGPGRTEPSRREVMPSKLHLPVRAATRRLMRSPTADARCDTATLRHCDTATLRHCDTATLRHCDTATLRRCDAATHATNHLSACDCSREDRCAVQGQGPFLRAAGTKTRRPNGTQSIRDQRERQRALSHTSSRHVQPKRLPPPRCPELPEAWPVLEPRPLPP